MADSLAVLPRSMGQETPGGKDPRKDVRKFIPEQRGGLLMQDPNEEKCPYTFKDSPAYVRQKKAEEQAKRAVELESKEETRGFLKSVEEYGKKQKWEEAFQVLERRTAVPSGLFLVTRALLRWKFGKYAGALEDAEEGLKTYGSSAKAGPLSAALASFLRICLGSQVRDKASCTQDMKKLIEEWELAEQETCRHAAFGQGLFHPRDMQRLQEPTEVIEGYLAHDGIYSAATGVKISYVFLKNLNDAAAPVLVHFHGSNETAADYRSPAMAKKYQELGVHLMVVDYRGYGWSTDQPSLATFIRDSEPFAEKLSELFVQFGLSWPYSGGLILSGRSLGAQVAVHLSCMYPTLFRYMMLDSAVATSVTGDRLGRANERSAALECWRKELSKASLEVLAPLDSELFCLSALEKIKAFNGDLLVIHGAADELVPYEGSESLHSAAASKQKELLLVEDAGHNNIGHYDAYWNAQKRFILKVQLSISEQQLPSIGPVTHLCAVCAEKAVSKCGRCQRVWYCGRKHQAEHWKSHKVTCAGGPPEPKPKVEPEADACLVALVTAHIKNAMDADQLAVCLKCLGSQAEPLTKVLVSWSSTAPVEVDEQVRQVLNAFEAATGDSLKVRVVQSMSARRVFEHVLCLKGALDELPAHAWLVFLEPSELLSTRYTGAMLPTLRRAAADPRTIAVSCPQRAIVKAVSPVRSPVRAEAQAKRLMLKYCVGKLTLDYRHEEGAPTERPLSAAIPRPRLPRSCEDVEEFMSTGKVALQSGIEASEFSLADYVVKVKTLQTFMEATPSAFFINALCTYRFLYRISHTYGKKVQKVSAPEGEWMRCSATSEKEFQLNVSEIDVRIGEELYDGVKNLSRFESKRATVFAILALREAIMLRLAQWAGEQVAMKDIRTFTNEQASAFLEKWNLSNVVGLNKYVRDVVTALAEASYSEFSVTVV